MDMINTYVLVGKTDTKGDVINKICQETLSGGCSKTGSLQCDRLVSVQNAAGNDGEKAEHRHPEAEQYSAAADEKVEQCERDPDRFPQQYCGIQKSGIGTAYKKDSGTDFLSGNKCYETLPGI